MLNTDTVTQSALLSTYDSIRLDVILILVFLIGFKLFTAYLMVVMTKWFEDDETADSAKPARDKKAKKARKQVPLARRVLWMGLGALWIINGAVQFRAVMVLMTQSALVHHSASTGPAWLQSVLHWGDKLWAIQPVWMNIGAATFQLIVGVFLVLSVDGVLGQIGLWLSILYAGATWVLWDGFGHVFRAGGTLFSGWPGAGLVYLLASALLVVPVRFWTNQALSKWVHKGFVTLFLLSVLWRLVPADGMWNSKGVQASFLSVPKAPGWIQSVANSAAQSMAGAPVLWNILFIAVLLALAVLTGFAFKKAWAMAIAFVWFAVVWIVGERLGLAGGFGLPLNTVPVLVLLWLAGWMAVRQRTAST